MKEKQEEKSVAMQTYLFLEEIYETAPQDSPKERESREMMDLVWNSLSPDEQFSLEIRGHGGRPHPR